MVLHISNLPKCIIYILSYIFFYIKIDLACKKNYYETK